MNKEKIECGLCGGTGKLECDDAGNEYKVPAQCSDCDGKGYLKKTNFLGIFYGVKMNKEQEAKK